MRKLPVKVVSNLACSTNIVQASNNLVGDFSLLGLVRVINLPRLINRQTSHPNPFSPSITLSSRSYLHLTNHLQHPRSTRSTQSRSPCREMDRPAQDPPTIRPCQIHSTLLFDIPDISSCESDVGFHSVYAIVDRDGHKEAQGR